MNKRMPNKTNTISCTWSKSTLLRTASSQLLLLMIFRSRQNRTDWRETIAKTFITQQSGNVSVQFPAHDLRQLNRSPWENTSLCMYNCSLHKKWLWSLWDEQKTQNIFYSNHAKPHAGGKFSECKKCAICVPPIKLGQWNTREKLQGLSE